MTKKDYLLIFLAIFLVSISVMAVKFRPQANALSPLGNTVEIDLDAYSFGFSESVINVNAGDIVKLKVSSTGGVHGVGIPDFGVSSGVLSPGDEEVITFIADKTGSFDFYCNIHCGDGHSRMRGVINVR